MLHNIISATGIRRSQCKSNHILFISDVKNLVLNWIFLKELQIKDY